ncbi:uncharacterized protein LOC112460064 isoform X1 [Temnothorax curvispinosus]|uniref:Uncharacterized protein LOC112460064 isoform X1 n=1 Tax=Temnothorax curvispinosus TaxID=300111 RepID=A0A6J1QES0_9HYME|nr:uncharacterized protein LOC112460064 isoform X1 [Temnothorax curvispinosus]
MWRTTKMTDFKDVASMNAARNPVPYPSLIAYGNKSVELGIMKDAINMYQDSFLEREKILEEEKRKLEELNYQVWSLEDSLCEQIWQFSREHDFSAIFQYHPFVIDCAKQRSNCKDGTVTERNSELIDLTNEIEVIEAEMIDLNQGEDVKREVESALTKLRKLQLTSDNITELLRLIRPSESLCKRVTISMPIYDEIIPNDINKIKRYKNDPGHAKQVETNKLDVTPKKKLVLTTPTNYPQLSLERSIMFTSNTFTSNEKFKNFTLKKRSKISIRFQEYREHKQ